ncbi:fungal-specific transcription factor domain-containing protein [Talaromyces proteolyticus]|uniref:Fungal-specific transcription factor domain-containing protein n=1 Tax=Talaromyces proteolyticus TaxID=1131652 RepID=A0AAD4KGI0_9EURO|nr:fungal-specific transcription factor domain-containing protein [Talaromyces proteolyticus]KAH8690620.1 fungal-specific transcription factor domain-containing protein [Talaromyces proteolyticus]
MQATPSERRQGNTQLIRQYRSRKQKPCDYCRQRKARCVRDIVGDCVLCRKRGVRCTFVSNPLVRHHVSRSVEAVDSLDSNSDTAQKLELGPLSPGSAVAASMARSQSGCEGSIEAAQYVGLSGDWDPFILANNQCRLIKNRDGIEWCSREIGHDPIMPIYFTSLRNLRPTADPPDDLWRCVEETVRVTREALIAAFFDCVHAAFPLLDRDHCLSHDLNPSLRVSMYLLGHPYCPDAREISSKILMDSYIQTRHLVTQKPQLETIEAAILFSQRQNYMSSGPNLSGLWPEVGSLVGLSQELGLNVDPSNWNIPNPEKRRRKRLWWAIYIIDKWSAMTLGRPSHIDEDQCNVSMLSISDFPAPDATSLVDEGASLTQPIGVDCFIAMTTLSVILSDLLKTLYTIKAVEFLREKPAELILSIAEPISTALFDWRTTFLEPLLKRNSFPDVTGSLELAYYTVEVMLCRAVYPKLYRRMFSTSSFLDRAADITSRVSTLVENLSLSRANVFWWSFSSLNLTICGTFMVSMIRLSPDREHIDFWKKSVSHYRKVLQAHSGSFRSAKSAYARLEVILEGVNFDRSQSDNLHPNLDQFDTTRTNIGETCETDVDVLEKSGLDMPSPDSTAGNRLLLDRMVYDINIDMDWLSDNNPIWPLTF